MHDLGSSMPHIAVHGDAQQLAWGTCPQPAHGCKPELHGKNPFISSSQAQDCSAWCPGLLLIGALVHVLKRAFMMTCRQGWS